MMKYLIVIASIALFSCSGNKRPSDVLSPEKMGPVLWDYIRADAFTTDYISRDSSKNPEVENVKMQKEIFAKYKVTSEVFYKSYKYYEDHPEQMSAMLDTVINRNRRAVVNAVPVADISPKVADSAMKKTDTSLQSTDGFRKRGSTIFPKTDSIRSRPAPKNILMNRKRKGKSPLLTLPI